MSAALDDVRDYEPAPELWNAPGPLPLFVIRNTAGEEREVDEALRPLPLPVRPSSGETWIDVGTGYGAFAAFASRLGAAVVPIEPDLELARLLGATRFLNDLVTVSDPIVEPITAELVERVAAGADGIRFANVPRGFSPPPALRKAVGTLPRSQIHRFAAAFDGAGFELRGFDDGWAPRVRVFAWRRPA